MMEVSLFKGIVLLVQELYFPRVVVQKLIEELTGCTKRRKFKINLQQFTDDKIDHVKPMAFKDLISEKNPLFKGIKANDSKDLVLFLLENMDSELTKRNKGLLTSSEPLAKRENYIAKVRNKAGVMGIQKIIASNPVYSGLD